LGKEVMWVVVMMGLSLSLRSVDTQLVNTRKGPFHLKVAAFGMIDVLQVDVRGKFAVNWFAPRGDHNVTFSKTSVLRSAGKSSWW